ncbi:glutamyl-tRNA synthetase [Geoalkalibacter ferrihydriticus]|uniref:Glutamate--tRNA ligase n=2 Tax=Geoalkalibacter ferrihydriticus TaxID=392333 RepID=A0A0C2EDU2_9BACT|nr:glutamate--tRNA ligase [Geoalkalibacter ferrihydriticus]KIH76743.1 glutamyl-tRNA synthetase [Geoalkalibacter ferrihydriticus DSM 17813]SDL53972.1 glutamyl-tRNA synthetase [Geoalkalibacter ferrihydriticus]
MKNLRVRFAPSPTGYLHIGGARTALFNFLIARKEEGTFVLRVEDTDVARSTQESVDAILQAMDWLGLSYDEGPYYQSQRTEIYREKIDQLLANGKAYRCYCTAEILEEKRQRAQSEGRKPKYDGTCRRLTGEAPADKPFVIRFQAPEAGETTFADRIKGTITFRNEELDDLIIQRSDGSPTYNFVVVVDDATMDINLVIRGDDHINNTPRQSQLYQALGYEVPQFAHVPMILGADKARLSKRHGATSVMAYKEMGYLPEAMVNYLVRLGWSHGDQEIFSMDELIEKFSLENVGKSAGVFNPGKLLWLNEHYIKTGDPVRLGDCLVPFLQEKGLDPSSGPALPEVVRTLQDRAKTLVEMAEGAAFYFKKELEFDGKAVAKFLTEDKIALFNELIEGLESLEDWNEETVGDVFKKLMDQHKLKLPAIAQPVRVALTGGTSSPSIFDVVVVLGRETSLRRLRNVLPLCGA